MKLGSKVARGSAARARPWAIAFFILTTAVDVLGQGIAPTADLSLLETQSLIDEKKRGLEQALGETTQGMKKTFLGRLAALEEKAVADGDLNAAAVIRDRRKKVKEEVDRFDPALIEMREAKAIDCPMKDAARTSGVLLLRDGALGRWKNVDSAATWDVRNVAPGEYAVEVTYSASKEVVQDDTHGPATAGGIFSFGEPVSASGAVHRPLLHKVKLSASWDDYQSERIGVIRIAAPSVKLTLTSLDVEPEGLMHLKGLRLIPLSVPSEELASTSPRLPNFPLFKESYDRLIQKKVAGMNQAYLQALEEIRSKAQSAQNVELVQKLDEQIQKVRKELGLVTQ